METVKDLEIINDQFEEFDLDLLDEYYGGNNCTCHNNSNCYSGCSGSGSGQA